MYASANTSECFSRCNGSCMKVSSGQGLIVARSKIKVTITIALFSLLEKFTEMVF